MTKKDTFAFIIFFYISGVVHGREIQMNDDITEYLGSNSIQLRCAFLKDTNDKIVTVDFLAKNATQYKEIAKFPCIDKTVAYLTTFGAYLFDNITLNNIAETSKEASIVFDNLACIHEREYICRLTVFPNGEPGPTTSISSKPMNIFAKVPPEKPDNITIVQENDASSVIIENETVTFTCSGDLGRPPGEYLWQKITAKNISDYPKCNTNYDSIDGSCSYNGTSNLTIQMKADDNQAVIRCVEISQIANKDMYQETDPLDVYYEVRKPTLLREPNQNIYDQTTTHITLTCNSDGNPQPSYAWYRNDTLIASERFFVIWNVVGYSSGLYVCQVNNTIEGKLHIETESFNILISDNREFTPDKESATLLPIIIGLCVSFVATVTLITAYMIKRLSNKQNVNLSEKSLPRNWSNSANDKLDQEDQEDGTEEQKQLPCGYNLHASAKMEGKYQHKTKRDTQQRPTYELDDDPYAPLKDGVYDKMWERRHLPVQTDGEDSYDTMDNLARIQDNLSGNPETTAGYDNSTEETAFKSTAAESLPSDCTLQQPDICVILVPDMTNVAKVTNDYENVSDSNQNAI